MKWEKGTWAARDGELLLNALCTQMLCALPGLGSFAEMKLFLALAGLLAPLAMLQTSDGATPGTSAKRREERVYWGAPQLSGSLFPVQASFALGPSEGLGPLLTL